MHLAERKVGGRGKERGKERERDSEREREREREREGGKGERGDSESKNVLASY